MYSVYSHVKFLAWSEKRSGTCCATKKRYSLCDCALYLPYNKYAINQRVPLTLNWPPSLGEDTNSSGFWNRAHIRRSFHNFFSPLICVCGQEWRAWPKRILSMLCILHVAPCRATVRKIRKKKAHEKSKKMLGSHCNVSVSVNVRAVVSVSVK